MTISAFGEKFIKTEIFPKDMGKDFNRAFDRRQLSDYNYIFLITKEEADELLLSGRAFFLRIREFLGIRS